MRTVLIFSKETKFIIFRHRECINKYGSNNIYDDQNRYSFRLRIKKLGLN